MNEILSEILFKMLTRIFSIAMVLVLSGVALAGAEAPRYVADELLVQTRIGAPGVEINRALAAQNAIILGEIKQIRVKQRVMVPLQALEKAKAALSQNPHFQFVEYNYLSSSWRRRKSKYLSSTMSANRAVPKDLLYFLDVLQKAA